MAEDIRRRGKSLEQRVHSSPEGKVAQNCATLLPGGGDERCKAADHAARLLGASPRHIQAAKRIRGMYPDLLPHVMSGKINRIDAQQAANLDPEMRSGVPRKTHQESRERGRPEPVNFPRESLQWPAAAERRHA